MAKKESKRTRTLEALRPSAAPTTFPTIIFRLRSEQELLAIVEEISAVYPKNVVIGLIRHATAEPYSFLYVDLAARRPELRFEKRLVPGSDSDSGSSSESSTEQ